MAEQKKSGCSGVFLTLVIVVAIVIVVFIVIFSNSDSSDDEDSTPTLNAQVRFTGTQFVIKNNDTFDWRDVKLEVNPRGLRSGYVLRVALMEAGEEYSVGAMQFAKKDGEKFNPFTHKAQSFSIFCSKGSYYGQWN